MNVTHAIPQDELLLAQLASAKLAKLIKGLMSVGVGSLQLESPLGFLADRNKVLLAFIEVLRCVGVSPMSGERYERLRHQADQLSDLVGRFHHHFVELAAWRTMSPPQVRATAGELVASYAELCQVLAAFRASIGVEADASAQVQQGREMIRGFLTEIVAPAKDSEARG
jgi:hypothetical protein